MEVSGPEPEGDGCTAETLQAAPASLFQRVWRAVLGQGRPKPPAKELDETHDFVKKVKVSRYCEMAHLWPCRSLVSKASAEIGKLWLLTFVVGMASLLC